MNGEHALAHLQFADLKGCDPSTEVPRLPADVLDREVGGEGRGPIWRQLELARRQGEVFNAVDGLKRVVRHREARNHHTHLPLADSQLRVGVQLELLAAGRERQARRGPTRSA
jgi:hypothetical protein